MIQGGAAYGVGLAGTKSYVCETCVTAKLRQTPFQSKSISREATGLNDLVHSDVVGPMSTQSFGGKKYVVFFIDDYSRYVTGYFLNRKSEVLGAFKQYKKLVENLHQRPIRRLRTDNRGEYTLVNSSTF
jgi:transposase InsO family protein